MHTIKLSPLITIQLSKLFDNSLHRVHAPNYFLPPNVTTHLIQGCQTMGAYEDERLATPKF